MTRRMLGMILNILRYIKKHPGCNPYQLRRDHFSSNRMFYHYKDWLVEQDLLRRKTKQFKKWRRTQYWITRKGTRLLKMFPEVK